MVRQLVPAAVLAGALVLIATAYAWARAQVMIPSPDTVRFEIVTNEPISTPDGRSVVAGWSAQVFKDRRTGQCYLARTQGRTMGIAPTGCGL